MIDIIKQYVTTHMTINQIKAMIAKQNGIELLALDLSLQPKNKVPTGWTSAWVEDTAKDKRVRVTMHNDTRDVIRGNREFSGLVIHSTEIMPAKTVTVDGVDKIVGEYTKYLLTMPKSITDSF